MAKGSVSTRGCLLENFPRWVTDNIVVKDKLLARLDTEKGNVFNTVQKGKQRENRGRDE